MLWKNTQGTKKAMTIMQTGAAGATEVEVYNEKFIFRFM